MTMGEQPSTCEPFAPGDEFVLRDRRRPGRLAADPALIPLLRGTAVVRDPLPVREAAADRAPLPLPGDRAAQVLQSGAGTGPGAKAATIPAETSASSAEPVAMLSWDCDPDRADGAGRGLVFGLALSIPLWGLLVAGCWLIHAMLLGSP